MDDMSLCVYEALLRLNVLTSVCAAVALILTLVLSISEELPGDSSLSSATADGLSSYVFCNLMTVIGFVHGGCIFICSASMFRPGRLRLFGHVIGVLMCLVYQAMAITPMSVNDKLHDAIFSVMIGAHVFVFTVLLVCYWVQPGESDILQHDRNVTGACCVIVSVFAVAMNLRGSWRNSSRHILMWVETLSIEGLLFVYMHMAHYRLTRMQQRAANYPARMDLAL